MVMSVFGTVRHSGGAAVGRPGFFRRSHVSVGIFRNVGLASEKALDCSKPLLEATILRAPHMCPFDRFILAPHAGQSFLLAYSSLSLACGCLSLADGRLLLVFGRPQCHGRARL